MLLFPNNCQLEIPRYLYYLPKASNEYMQTGCGLRVCGITIEYIFSEYTVEKKSNEKNKNGLQAIHYTPHIAGDKVG